MQKYKHVTIIGSGIGGLSAASVIAPYAQHVTIFDKDTRPAEATSRKGVPQGNHISILLQAGLNNLEQIFPGIRKKLIENGSAQIQAGTGQQIFEYGQWMPKRELDLVFLGLSRPFLEHTVYQSVLDIKNISVNNNKSVKRLSLSEDGSVDGIVLGDDSEDEIIYSDLVVDASGPAGKFINQLSKELDKEIQVDSSKIDIFYSTAHFKKPPELANTKENILVVPECGITEMGGCLIDIEGDKWCISLHGKNNIKPPKNLAEWFEAAQQLPDKRIWDRVLRGTPVGDIKTFKKTHATWRRFELLDQAIDGYLPLGDTISSVNPIFGQGMSVTTGHALALAGALSHENHSSLWNDYVNGAAEWSKKAWTKANAYDSKIKKEANLDYKKAAILKSLTKARIQKFYDDPNAHYDLILQTQMLA